ncbi:hypothetical protein N0U25_28810, partial [Pseudomonas sivasensis]|uniref:hypothetical protein n=1 Tax=Pseudomonas sivasensis TaxID=1880678 RepID=UPI0021A9AAF1
MVGRPVTDAGFRHHDEDADDREAADPEQRRHVHRNGAVEAVEQQDEGAERVARDLADIHLAALPGPACEHLGRGDLGREHEIRDLSGIPL